MAAIAHSLLACALLVAGVAAAPSSAERYARRMAARNSHVHYSKPLHVIKTTDVVSNGTQDSLSSNWAGAILSSSHQGTWTSVTGTFTIPTPSMSSASGSPQFASALVGIDGASCKDGAFLQIGVDFTVDNSGPVSYDAWWAWGPGGGDFPGFSLNAGDTITLTVAASSGDQVTVSIENQSTGVEEGVLAAGGPPLCQRDAVWVVEDKSDASGQMLPFANFGTVSFTDATPVTANGTLGPSGATIDIVNIFQNDEILTSTTMHGSLVTISYIG